MRRFLFVAGIVALLAVFGTAISLYVFPPQKTSHTQITKQDVAPVKAAVAVDLSGKWESEVSQTGMKMVATVQNGTIFVEMYKDKAYTGLWYGTFDFLQPGEKEVVSKFIDDPNHFALSTAKTKDFLYQDGSLVFEYSVFAVRTIVEMKRV